MTTDDLVRYVRDELADDLRAAAANLTGTVDVLNAIRDLTAATGPAADAINAAARQLTGSRDSLLHSWQALAAPAEAEPREPRYDQAGPNPAGPDGLGRADR